MNEHQSVRGLLALAAAGVLAPQDQLRVERHTGGCDACLREFETWKAYADGLHRLPQPAVPMHLASRTQARLAQAQLEVAEPRSNGLVLVSLSLFGWILSFAVWLVLRLSSGGAFLVMGTNILRPDLWSLGWTVFAWASGVTAAIVLARHQREWRRLL